jgi:hypothetical protein
MNAFIVNYLFVTDSTKFKTAVFSALIAISALFQSLSDISSAGSDGLYHRSSLLWEPLMRPNLPERWISDPTSPNRISSR